jgi:hypothetical protein
MVRLAPVSVPEGISYKLRRAHEQLETLDVEIKRFLEADPKTWRVVSHDDPDTRDRIYGIEVIEAPPAIRWGVLTSEIVHHLRTGLDHLAYALCLAHAPGKAPPRGTEFPIFWNEDRFDDVKPGGGRYKIRGMSWEMQSAIRDLQPSQRGDAAQSQSLWLLQEMSNIDKHRYLNLTVLGYPGISFFEDPDVEMIPVWSEDGSIVARAHPLTPEAEVKNDPMIVPQIVLNELPHGDWRPLDVQLRTFCRITTDIVQDLSNSFLSN